MAIKGLLDEQVREREGIKQGKDALQQQEAHELTKLWQGEEAAEKAAAEQERLHQQSMYNEMLNENRSHFPLICWHHSNIPTQVFFFVTVFHILLSFLSKSAVRMKICLCIQ